jgi:hypothetical protein
MSRVHQQPVGRARPGPVREDRVPAPILVGTSGGLWTLDGERHAAVAPLAGGAVTALATDGPDAWAIVDGRVLWQRRDGRWAARATMEGPAATCVAPGPDGPLIGTEQAHLFHLTGDRLQPIEPFEQVEGRGGWYTPWGDPADVRSVAVAADGIIYVNVHVGGVARSTDGGGSWAPTLDIEVDVHQVLAHPVDPRVVLVAAAAGLGVSRDGGLTWRFATTGMHAHYLRAVAVAGEHVLVSASTGFEGRRAAIYRRPLDAPTGFARCADGLPKWFDDNIDTGCLVAAGGLVVFGTGDGRVFRSLDAGTRWALVTDGLPPITCVSLG